MILAATALPHLDEVLKVFTLFRLPLPARYTLVQQVQQPLLSLT